MSLLWERAAIHPGCSPGLSVLLCLILVLLLWGGYQWLWGQGGELFSEP